ncbi:hypothetical protein [Lentzea sp. NPDC051838]|uniref:hypothetical protein n=1 Tax=Lentzea sp. NPDC051838 TaxID=3154849 RepID=UPI003420F483
MRRLALFVLLCAALTGCAAIADLATLQTRIHDTGYENVSLYHRSNNGVDTLEITANGPDPDEVAQIVWDTYPEHIDHLSITLPGGQTTYTEAELRDTFGERQVTEKPDDDTDVTKTLVTWLIIGGVAFLLLVLGVIILIVVLVRRSRRKAQQQPYPHLPYPPPPGPPAA